MNNPTPGASNLHDIVLDLKVFLEGPYNGLEMNTNIASPPDFPYTQPYNTEPWNYPGDESVVAIPNQSVVDWVLIEMREATSAALATESTIRERKAGFVLKNGSITDISGSNDLVFNFYYTDSLYVVVKHRNHLGVMSAFGLKENTGIFSYDLTTSAAQNYGGTSAVTELAFGVWGMIAGDADASDVIDNSDKNLNWMSEVGISGYLSGDLNLDRQVNNQDKNEYWLPNEGKGSMVPE
jgi:hypothetical protein